MASISIAPRGRWARAWSAIDERTGVSALAYPVPRHANGIGYILGGITFFGLVILTLTGIWLAQFYHPTPEAARSSIVYIMNVAPLGDIVRGIHFWTANIVMGTVLLHLGRIFVTGAYKRPREVNWLIGVGLLAVTLGLLLTGTILKWDQEGYEALNHNVAVANLLGGLGGFFSADFAATLPVLGRLYIAHIIILPGIGVLLLVAHFLLIKHLGISPRPAEADAAVDGGPSPVASGSVFTAHLVRMAGYGLVILAVGIVLTILFPAGLGPRPIPGTETTKPPWMFLPLYPLEDGFGIPGMFWGLVALFGGLVLLPFLDRSRYRSAPRRRAVMTIGIFVAAVLVALVVYATVTPPQAHIMGKM